MSSLSDRALVNVQRPQLYNKMGIIRHWNIVKRDCKECLFQEIVEKKALLAALILALRSSAVPRRDPRSFTDLQLSSSLAALKYSVLLTLSLRFSFRNTASQSSTVDFTDWWFESWRVVSSAYWVYGAGSEESDGHWASTALMAPSAYMMNITGDKGSPCTIRRKGSAKLSPWFDPCWGVRDKGGNKGCVDVGVSHTEYGWLLYHRVKSSTKIQQGTWVVPITDNGAFAKAAGVKHSISSWMARPKACLVFSDIGLHKSGASGSDDWS